MTMGRRIVMRMDSCDRFCISNVIITSYHQTRTGNDNLFVLNKNDDKDVSALLLPSVKRNIRKETINHKENCH